VIASSGHPGGALLEPAPSGPSTHAVSNDVHLCTDLALVADRNESLGYVNVKLIDVWIGQ